MLKAQRRTKYMQNNHKINKGDIRLNINFNISTLEIMASYCISENRSIRRSMLMQMRNLFSMLDESLYEIDQTKKRYFDFIKLALKGKLEDGIKDLEVLDKYINGGVLEDDGEEQIHIKQLKVLGGPEIDWVSKTISESLKYSYIYSDMDDLYELLVQFRASDYSNKGEIVKQIENQIANANNLFRKAKSEQSQEVTFSLRDGVFEDSFKEIYEQLTNPSCRLFTGMQGFNSLIGGAFEMGRIYLLMGLAGAGKSWTLLNIAKQIKNNNKHYRPKDPTKIPVVVILTMENTVKETVSRLFESVTGYDMKNMSVEDAMKCFKEQGEMYLSDDNPIDIIVKFVPNRSVDTSYLYTLAEDLEDEGYEMICLIQDHVKRIRSIERTTDMRIELGNVVNEMKTFSMLKDCVVITNGHLNREAARSIDDGNQANKADLIRMIGRSNVGESMLMIDNVDIALILQQEYDAEGNRYMGFKRVKERVKCNPMETIVYQKFKAPDSMELIEDLNQRIPMHRDTLKSDANIINLNKAIETNKYKVLEDNSNILNDEFNIFDYKDRHIVEDAEKQKESDKIQILKYNVG